MLCLRARPRVVNTRVRASRCVLCFFFNDTATTEIYTLSLHDALPIRRRHYDVVEAGPVGEQQRRGGDRSEEHTSELQSRGHLVCRLLLEKKNHARTGQPMPEELMQRVLAARTFNQGCATVEYVASALVDLFF